MNKQSNKTTKKQPHMTEGNIAEKRIDKPCAVQCLK